MPTAVELTGVPETMLWTLYNRAEEAKRADAMLRDPDCIRVYESIAYDFARSFGKPDTSHPYRSKLFDEALRPWLAAHPGGTVVELAAGLETQFQRCDDGKLRWLCIDVPEALTVRERFLPASERCRYVALSALDLRWLDEVDASKGVFVSAQGLFMYFHEADVRRLFVAICERFPGVTLMFDSVPHWFSKLTLKGFGKTEHYRAPPMPWGIASSEVEATLKGWSSRVRRVHQQAFGEVRGMLGLMLRVFPHVPGLRDLPPLVVRVET
jgi:O-methyltransferase involved in polyketide biosynthesis